MDAHELEDRLAGFRRWHYRFEFDGGIATPMPERAARRSDRSAG
jgi:hypothetical protein